MPHPTRLLPLLASVWLGGCAGGAFQQATLVRDCKPGESNCHRAVPAAPLAVGAMLRPTVDVDVAGSLMPIIALRSSREDIVSIEDGALHARKPGLAAVLIGSSDGTVLDFQHVWVAQPTAIVIERPSPMGAGVEEVSGPLELVAGEQLMLTSSLLAVSQRLAGEGDMAWTIAGDDSAIALLRDGSSGRRRLVARHAGTAHVTVSTLGVTTTVDVEVMP
jgi:hypothetical protein